MSGESRMDVAAKFEKLRMLTSRINRTMTADQIELRLEYLKTCDELVPMLKGHLTFVTWAGERAREHLSGLVPDVESDRPMQSSQ
jgi:hypothetical protein